MYEVVHQASIKKQFTHQATHGFERMQISSLLVSLGFHITDYKFAPKEKLPVASCIPDSSATSEDTSVGQCLSYHEALPSDPGSSDLISPV